MNESSSSQSPYRGNRAISVLRVVVWLIPAFVLPFGAALAAWLREFWLLAIIPISAAFAALGYFDMRLKLQQEQIDPSSERESIYGWALTFALVQLIIAPAIAITLIFGICMIGGGYF